MKTNHGGQAFPMFDQFHGEAHNGMTLRDYFAGQALAGLLAGQEEHFVAGGGENLDQWRKRLDGIWAAFCYDMADAMLERRASAQGLPVQREP